MKVIPVNLEHLDMVAPLFDAYMVFYNKPSDLKRYKKFLKERIENNEAQIYMAIKDNQAMGFVLNYTSFSSVSLGRVVVLNDLFVSLAYRTQGVAEALIAKSIEYAKETNALRIDLSTGLDNYNAQRLYDKLGFIKDDAFVSFSFSLK